MGLTPSPRIRRLPQTAIAFIRPSSNSKPNPGPVGTVNRPSLNANGFLNNECSSLFIPLCGNSCAVSPETNTDV